MYGRSGPVVHYQEAELQAFSLVGADPPIFVSYGNYSCDGGIEVLY